MRGLKKASDEQNDKKTLCVAFDGWLVAVKIMQILATFPRARPVKPDNNSINIRDLNRLAVWTFTFEYSLQGWNIEAQN